jgi:glucose/arabinose dehydrogenase
MGPALVERYRESATGPRASRRARPDPGDTILRARHSTPARTALVAALLALAALAFAACGSSDDDDRGDTTPPPTQTQLALPPPATTTTPAPAPEPEGGARGIRLARLGTFDEPTDLTSRPDDANTLFVVEKGGTIRVMRDGEVLDQPLLDISDRVSTGSEQGLLSMAVPPDFAQSRRFYVNYTDVDGTTQVVEYRTTSGDPNRADPDSARTVLSQEQPESNHNGGQLQFGPDGMLYIGFGDGGGAGDQHGDIGNGQDLGTWLGKILRIDPRPSGGKPYTVPADNPFVNREGARPEIWVYGLRNPWRFSFDRKTGALTIGDVGQDAVEEIDYTPASRTAGSNFGWRAYEGAEVFDPDLDAGEVVRPAVEHSHDEGWCSITGGYVIRDPALAALDGQYVYGDFCQPNLWMAKLRFEGSSDDRQLEAQAQQVSSFGQDADGRIYVVSLAGPVSRIVAR